MVKKIIHTADLHLKRDPQYHKQFYSFEKHFLSSIEVKLSDVEYEEGLIVIVGDLYHDKDKQSHRCDIILYRFLESCLNIAPVLVIPGNHDFLNKEDDLFLMEKVVLMLDNKNLYFSKKSESFEYQNIFFHHFSNLEDSTPPKNMKKIIDDNPDYIHIGLYHDPLRNCQSFGYVFDQYDKDVTMFNGLDHAMLGDIHEFQVIPFNTGKAVYSGSPYQQSNGELMENHGYVIWELKGKKYRFDFVPLNNDFNFVKIKGDFESIITNKQFKYLN